MISNEHDLNIRKPKHIYKICYNFVRLVRHTNAVLAFLMKSIGYVNEKEEKGLPFQVFVIYEKEVVMNYMQNPVSAQFGLFSLGEREQW